MSNVSSWRPEDKDVYKKVYEKLQELKGRAILQNGKGATLGKNPVRRARQWHKLRADAFKWEVQGEICKDGKVNFRGKEYNVFGFTQSVVSKELDIAYTDALFIQSKKDGSLGQVLCLADIDPTDLALLELDACDVRVSRRHLLGRKNGQEDLFQEKESIVIYLGPTKDAMDESVMSTWEQMVEATHRAMLLQESKEKSIQLRDVAKVELNVEYCKGAEGEGYEFEKEKIFPFEDKDWLVSDFLEAVDKGAIQLKKDRVFFSNVDAQGRPSPLRDILDGDDFWDTTTRLTKVALFTQVGLSPDGFPMFKKTRVFIFIGPLRDCNGALYANWQTGVTQLHVELHQKLKKGSQRVFENLHRKE